MNTAQAGIGFVVKVIGRRQQTVLALMPAMPRALVGGDDDVMALARAIWKGDRPRETYAADEIAVPFVTVGGLPLGLRAGGFCCWRRPDYRWLRQH